MPAVREALSAAMAAMAAAEEGGLLTLLIMVQAERRLKAMQVATEVTTPTEMVVVAVVRVPLDKAVTPLRIRAVAVRRTASRAVQ